jgi:hypothetical protein
VHDYLGVDEDIVWQVVTGDLPRLLPVLYASRPRPCNSTLTAVAVVLRGIHAEVRDNALADSPH